MNNLIKNSNFKKIIVFGSTGYVGNSIFLGLRKSYEVISSSRNKNNLHFLSEKKCENIPNDIDISIFAIGSTELDSDSFNSSSKATLNTLSLFLDRHKKDIPNTPIIYISTFQVYGKNEGKIDELTNTNPSNIYALVHKQAEEMLQLYAKNNNCKYLIIRPTNIYGSYSGEFPFRRETLVPNCFIKEALLNETITVNASKSVYKDFVNIKDVVLFLESTLKNFDLLEKINLINIYSGNVLEIYTIAKTIKKIITKNLHRNIKLTRPNWIDTDEEEQQKVSLNVTSIYKEIFPFFIAENNNFEDEILKLIMQFQESKKTRNHL